MSTINSKNVQVGTSNVAAENFTLYQPSTPDGTVRLGVGNSGATTADVVTVNSSGNVGIGTSSPTVKLDVSGSLAVSGAISGAVVATQSDQETATSITTLVTPGRQQFHPSAAKGWVKAASNGTSAVSFNVSSITDGGVGRVVVNWTVPFSSANYVALGTAQKSTSLSAATTLIVQERTDSTASACHMDIIDSSGTAFQDPNYTNIAAWGDQ